MKSFQKPDKSEHSEGPVDEAEDIADGCGDADGSEGSEHDIGGSESDYNASVSGSDELD